MTEFIKIENAYKKFVKRGFNKYSEVIAVNNVNLILNKGETLGLVGESGSGKTTLGRGILDLEPLNSGSVFINGVDISKLSKKDKKKYLEKMQIIFQDPYSALNPRMSAVEIVKEPLKNMDDTTATKKAEEILELVGIKGDSKYKRPKAFSGGQRQRIGIARAIINNPEFILCDEPTSALDVSIQAQILKLLVDIQKKFKLTYLFISHDLSVVKYISDRIVVMYKGYIVEIAKTNQIFENPQHEYTKKLLSTAPIADPALAKKMFDNGFENKIDIEVSDTDVYVEIEEGHYVRTRKN